MAAPVVVIVLLLCFLAFLLWDRRRLGNAEVQPLSREQMKKGFAPSAALAWPVSMGMGVVGVTLAYLEWRSPSQRPYSGRWAWLHELVYQAFGPHGLAGFFAAVGVFLIGYGILRWRRAQ
ncbi:hypothetical protein [Variovorax sp. OV329]|uniref:hypothetical protein n=1 Tax=Variovorax sp. OV329 TaxID=1882825 RepID=UPI000B84E624|nr:hypothetical protein [Variovorax sp. OV329]